jgi:hypothetical protein
MYMEAALGIFLYSYPYFKLAKLLCLPYYCLCLLFNYIEEGRLVLPGIEDGGWERELVGDLGERWHNVCTSE